MTKMGRPNKPVALKKLQGTYRKDRDSDAATIADDRKPYRPAWLSDKAKPVWDRLAPVLYDSQLLTYADREQFAAYCEAVANMIEMQEAYRESLEMMPGKGLIQKTHNGNYIPNPLIAQARKAREEVIKIAREFGMTPSARSGIKLPGQVERELSVDEELFALADAQLSK